MSNRESIREWKALFDENDEDFNADELARLLDAYTVEFPPEQVIQQTIENCLVHVPQHQTHVNRLVKQCNQFMHMMIVQTSYLARSYWFFSLLLFLCGYLGTLHEALNPYKTVLLLAPMPLVLGVLELMRGVDSGMAEIELACKMSLPQMVMAGLVLLGVYNVVLNSAISMCLYWTCGIDLWKVVLLWLVPFTWVSSIMLFVATKFRGRMLAPIGLGIWAAAVLELLSFPKMLSSLLSMSDVLLLLFAVIGLGLLCFESKSLYRCMGRGMLIEAVD